MLIQNSHGVIRAQRMAAHVDDFLNDACDNPFQKYLVLRIWESKSAGYFSNPRLLEES